MTPDDNGVFSRSLCFALGTITGFVIVVTLAMGVDSCDRDCCTHECAPQAGDHLRKPGGTFACYCATPDGWRLSGKRP